VLDANNKLLSLLFIACFLSLVFLFQPVLLILDLLLVWYLQFKRLVCSGASYQQINSSQMIFTNHRSLNGLFRIA